MSDYVHVDFSDLVGKTVVKIYNEDGHLPKQYDSEINFLCDNGDVYTMYHEQSCCERVSVEDICGDWDDIINTPITVAVESTNRGNSDEYSSSTWTFYNISTNRGNVFIRWYGSSNGYYSESVNFKLVKNNFTNNIASDESLAICRLIDIAEDYDKVKSSVIKLVRSIKSGYGVEESVDQITKYLDE